MSETGECLDHAVAERVFGSLTREWTSQGYDATRQEARDDIIEYIEMFYHSRRKHSYLGYVSPNTYAQFALVAYLSVRFYLTTTLELGRRPELVGGGLIRSVGGWSEVKSQRRRRKQELADERILGSGDFVERIIRAAEMRVQRQYSGKERGRKVERLIAEECKKRNVSLTELRSGSRRGEIPAVRAEVSR
jgi:hypothetical protein